MKTILYVIGCCLFPAVLLAANTPDEPAADILIEDVDFEDIQLPEKDTPEHWVIRSDAVGEIIPLLTKKRAEIKQKRQQVSDYLLRIGQTEEMAAQQIEVPEDPVLYARALGLTPRILQRDSEPPKTLPTWEETVEFAMRFIISEGYVPIQFDGVEDIQGFMDVCRRKETYARKVRDEMRAYLNDYLEMWLYLEKTGEQFAYREWLTQLQQEADQAQQAERDRAAEQRRLAAIERRELEKQQKFQLAREREAFRSTRQERVYYTHQLMLLQRQALLDAYLLRHYYCW